MALGAALAAVLVAPLGARAATLQHVAVLSPNHEQTSPSRPSVAANGKGLTIAGWITRAGANGAVDNEVRVVERNGAGPWGSPQTLGTPAGNLSYDIRLAVASTGFAVAAWTDGIVGTRVATRSTTGTWSAPSAGFGGFNPEIAMQPDGTTLVIFETGTETKGVIVTPNGAVTPAFSIFLPGAGGNIDAIAVTPTRNDPTLWVVSNTWHNGSALHVAVRDVDTSQNVSPFVCNGFGGDFDPNVTIPGASPQLGFRVSVVADKVGGIATGFDVSTDVGTMNPKTEAVLAHCQAAMAGWDQKVFANASTQASVSLSLVAGHATAAWNATAGVMVADRNLRSAPDDWKAARQLAWSALGVPANPDAQLNLAIDSAGETVLGITAIRPAQHVFTALHRLAGTTVWQRDSADVQPAANLSSAYIPAVASPFTGGFVAVWRNPLADRYARTADLDVGPPRVAVSGLPSHVVGGRLVRLHASATDNWSGPSGTFTWHFGDGSPAATGATVSHRFRKAGTLTVTASIRDVAGNVGTGAPHVVVAAPRVTLTRFRVVGLGWRVSRVVGQVRIKFKAPAGAKLRLLVRKVGGRKVLFAKRIGVRARSITSALPGKILPGTYLISVAGTSGGAPTAGGARTLRIRAPATGVVGDGWITATRHGQPRSVISGFQTQLWAYVRFAVRPHGDVTVTWHGPAGESRSASGSFRAGPPLEFRYADSGGLSHGTWRADVSVRGKLVARLRIRIR